MFRRRYFVTQSFIYLYISFSVVIRCIQQTFPVSPGTSTDVSRYAGQYEHVFEATTAGVTLQAPQLDINTVAAGGGSRLFFRSAVQSLVFTRFLHKGLQSFVVPFMVHIEVLCMEYYCYK